MKHRTRRSPWLLLVIGVLGIVVLAAVAAFAWRLLHPPVEPFVEEADGSRRVIQCEITNASGRQGAGRHVLAFLRERGFDVVELSTSHERQRRSMVIDRIGDRTSSLKLARILGIHDTLVVPSIDSMLFVRASVIIGDDVGQLKPFED